MSLTCPVCLPECSMLIQGTPGALNRHHNLLAYLVSRLKNHVLCIVNILGSRKTSQPHNLFLCKSTNCLHMVNMVNTKYILRTEICSICLSNPFQNETVYISGRGSTFGGSICQGILSLGFVMVTFQTSEFSLALQYILDIKYFLTIFHS